MSFTIETEGLDRLKFYAQAARATLPEEMQVTTDMVVSLMGEVLSELYPAGMVPYWTITSAPSPSGNQIAAVDVTTNNAIVYWWEFGTNPTKPIFPVNKRSLRFETSASGWVNRAYVMHPQGIKAHNKRFELAARLKAEAKRQWKMGIAAFFENL